MYRDGRYSDIPLKISEDGRLSVHRVALALLSLTLKPFSGKIGTMERKKKYMTDIWFIWFGRSIHKISNLKDLLFY